LLPLPYIFYIKPQWDTPRGILSSLLNFPCLLPTRPSGFQYHFAFSCCL
jgi:hypothetical protein